MYMFISYSTKQLVTSYNQSKLDAVVQIENKNGNKSTVYVKNYVHMFGPLIYKITYAIK